MKSAFLVLLELLVVWSMLLVPLSSTYAVSPHEEIVTFISQTKLGDNFRQLTYRAAMNTETYRIIVAKTTSSEAREILNKELDKTLPKYQQQWNENLALAYLEYLTSQELNSVFTERNSSPYLKKFQEKQADIGQSMQRKSSDLLVKAVAEVIGNAFQSIAP